MTFDCFKRREQSVMIAIPIDFRKTPADGLVPGVGEIHIHPRGSED
jgi:hypothetical protein